MYQEDLEFEELEYSSDSFGEDFQSDSEENYEDFHETRHYSAVQQQLADSLYAQADISSLQCFQNDPQGAREADASGSTEDPHGRLANKEWCHCGQCICMPTVAECVCCREHEVVLQMLPEACVCVTQHPLFAQYALVRENIEHAIRLSALVTRRQYDTTNNRVMRVGAYRSYTAWIHGFLGKNNRIPIPACVIKSIRTAYPDPQGNYTGFQIYMDLTESNLDFQLNL
ncbi:uncharacterized protein [Eleutherodactylus coqui]|uniref:uncharacterized protein n=1 Tax=Eleutherodactylus coqui TaxID=57060 RepID=UPI0034633359